MKGVTVFRAQPSNAIDIYPLLKKAAAEKTFVHNPNEKQLQDFYFQRLITQELPSPIHFYYLARRGRGFLGLLHAIAVPGRWDGRITTITIDMVYVTEKRRKMGIGKQMIDQLIKDADEIGIKSFEFLCKDELVDYWAKKRKAVKLSNHMRIEL